MKRILDRQYNSKLTLTETQIAIKFVKDTFQKELSKKLKLLRVSAPLFVLPKTGLNDNLSGKEEPVSFKVLHLGEEAEIVHSLAKWKRIALDKYEIELHNLHSLTFEQSVQTGKVSFSQRLYGVTKYIAK